MLQLTFDPFVPADSPAVITMSSIGSRSMKL
jgi:hypothetical protein